MASEEISNHWLQLAFNDFDTAEKLFLDNTSNILRLDQEKAARIAQAQKTGDAADKAGDAKRAFQAYLAAFSELPSDDSADADHSIHDTRESLRELIIRESQKVLPPPLVPEEANRHYSYALAAIEDFKSTPDPAKLSDAADQLGLALRLAPWWPEAYFNLGVVLENAERYTDAARALNLYLEAAPNAPDATAVRQKIYQLEYKSGAR
jgi:tetratricopeptide (TPR) repeat protein